MSTITMIIILCVIFILFVLLMCMLNLKRIEVSAHEECYHTKLDCENCSFSSRCSSISNPAMLITVKEEQDDG